MIAMVWRRLGVFGLLCVSALGCVPEYHPPTLAEPHAVVKLRRTYDVIAGVYLREQLLVDDHLAYAASTAASLGAAARIDALLLHPTPAELTMASTFFHQETRRVYETYYEQVSKIEYETYDCSSGSGTSRSYRSCTRSVTRYHSEPRQRWVTRVVDVDDRSCQTGLRFAPVAGRVYLLQYSFQQHGVCSLSCFEQLPQADGTFQNRRCSSAPPRD
jgi:hypothetical protein